ncbi:MAG: hypothetical protein ABI904_05175 [Chloroflexota bacterium]
MTDKKKNKLAVKKPSVKKAKPTKPNKKKAAAGGHSAGNELSGRGFTLSLGGDRSLQAYKNWVRGILLSIKPDAKETRTEEEWVKSWMKFWEKSDHAPKKAEADNVPAKPRSLEEQYPGITAQIRRFEEAELPSCPHCGSGATASVQVGLIGRTMCIAGSTKKFKLVMNMADKLGTYFCNECKKFFD